MPSGYWRCDGKGNRSSLVRRREGPGSRPDRRKTQPDDHCECDQGQEILSGCGQAMSWIVSCDLRPRIRVCPRNTTPATLRVAMRAGTKYLEKSQDLKV